MSTFPVSDSKNVGMIKNPPGTVELKKAVTPLFVSANGVALPGTSVSKLNVAVVVAAGEAPVPPRTPTANAALAKHDLKVMCLLLSQDIRRSVGV
jgi:hypothetical protein